MTALTVHASKKYEALIGRGLLDSVGETVARLWKGKTAAVVSDTNVAPRYLGRVENSLRQAGFAVCSFIFPAGEPSKTVGTWFSLMEFLAKHRLTRADGIVALGGGVVGDLAGFAAQDRGSEIRGNRDPGFENDCPGAGAAARRATPPESEAAARLHASERANCRL